MINRVIKRDGVREDFTFMKIRRAVEQAFKSCDKTPSEELLIKLQSNIEATFKDVDEVDIELIQDAVISFLEKERGCKKVASHYKEYRETRDRARNKSNKILQGMKEKLDAKNIENQNANVDEMSFGGRMGEANRVALKQLALDEYMSPMARKNHLENRDYIHDLDSYAAGEHNCLSIPYDDILAKGFNTRQTDVRPARSVGTAFQLVAVVAQLQSLQQFGGVSATHLDWTMVPYVKMSFRKHIREWWQDVIGWTKDEAEQMVKQCEEKYGELNYSNEKFKEDYEAIYNFAFKQTEREIYQAVEGMYHNLNTLQSRSGNQLPFTSINYGTCTLPEGRSVTKALLDLSIKGLGSLHKTSIFPCGIFQYMKGVNDKPCTPNYDLKLLALKSTSQRLYPNYANVDWSGNAGYDINDPRTYFSTMGCRTANGWDVNGFGQLKDGRGNICPCTVILPTLAMEAKEKCNAETNGTYTEEMLLRYFLEYLNKNIEEVKDMLIERFNWICSQPAESAKFMYENGTMAGYIPEEGIRSALKHGTLAIGQLGLAETLQILIGCDHTTKHGMEVAKRIEQVFKDRCAEFKQKYKLNFGVYYTPAETLCYTAMIKFRKKYGIIPNVSDHEYFTNSIHVPVWREIDPFEKIDIESQLTGYSSAGCITYVELPSTTKNNIEALETIVDYAMDHDIPYFAVNEPNDTCLDCGYTDEIGDECPICGGKHIRRLRRVTGYLTGDYKTAFNYGKQCETEERVKHIKN